MTGDDSEPRRDVSLGAVVEGWLDKAGKWDNLEVRR
jgi:hypothetical protein